MRALRRQRSLRLRVPLRRNDRSSGSPVQCGTRGGIVLGGVGKNTGMENDPHVESRAENLLPEEQAAGSDDPAAQAGAILQESDERQNDRKVAPDTVLEHRTSEDTTPPAG